MQPTYAQQGILDDVPSVACHLFYALHTVEQARGCLQQLALVADGVHTVVGIGASLAAAFGVTVPGLRVLTVKVASGIEVPSTPYALWCWLRGEDQGELWHRARQINTLMLPAFHMTESIDTFKYDSGRDLSGYEDGTENPKADAAITAAILSSSQSKWNGSSFVALQQWQHDMSAFDSMSTNEQNNVIGRDVVSNKELSEAPISAHVKRTAQESFTPPAFVLRRSMPWKSNLTAGLMFVAFGSSFDAFEALLKRMCGEEDGVIDALFRFTRPINGAYFWCPGLTSEGKLNFTGLFNN